MRTVHKSLLLCSCAQLGALCLVMGRTVASPQAPVTVQVEVLRHDSAKPLLPASAQERSSIAVWLTPLNDSSHADRTSGGGVASSRTVPTRPNVQLVQKNKSFDPHVLIVQTGSTVQFPNKDPFFHNVFSLFDGKRFDLGLYEGGSSNSMRFDRPGVSFLFCNIHPEMSAVIVVVDTPYYTLSDHAGRIVLNNLPAGRYLMHVWYERASIADLKALDHVVNISDSTRSLDTVQVVDTGDYELVHKNKYGLDYTPQTNASYKRP
jgi:plastocyanin